MKRAIVLIFLLINFLLFVIFPKNTFAAANLQFIRTQVCYTGTILVNPSDYPSWYCTNNLYDAYWRFRYRISNIGDQTGFGTVCYSDSSAGSGSSMTESKCLHTYEVTVKPGSFVDVNDSQPLVLCKWGFLGIHQKGSSVFPYYTFSDKEWLSLSTPCPR